MKIINKSLVQNWPVIVLILLSVITIWPTLQLGYFSHHDDLQVMRIFEMRKCLVDFQIPCRWVPDMGYGNGYPMFNYYGVFPYYLGAIISFGLGYIWAVKALFAISLLLGFFSYYLLSKEIFKDSNLAFLSAVLFGFAPYRALDVYVRGALDESFAIATIPLVFYFSLRLIKEKKLGNFLGLTLTLFVFLTTHNIMVLFFLPILLIWVIYWLTREKSKNILQIILGFGLGFGLAAFFIIPAFFEKNLVQIDNLIRLDLDFRAHFVTFNQLFLDRSWGYGASSPGINDTISFQIGWPHWWLVIVSFALVVYQTIKSKKRDLLFYILFLVFIFSILMTHNKSAFIWERIPLLSYAQFPWRFLSVIIFTASLLGVWWISFLPKKLVLFLVIMTTLFTVWMNFSFFKPEIYYPNLTDAEKLSGKLWEEQQKAAIFDYLPKAAIEAKEPASLDPIIMSGGAGIENYHSNSNSFSFKAKVDEEVTIELPIYDFPNWTTYLDNAKVAHSKSNNLGRISLNLGPGEYDVRGKFEDTPIRIYTNLISLISFLVLIWIIKTKKMFQ